MRRPIASRDKTWAQRAAKFLASRGVTPNFVSGASVFFAALAALCLICAGQVSSPGARAALFFGAGLCVQARLLCNLFDGMLAVEFGKGSALGPLWNDFPDRPADVLILVGCGYSGGPAWMPVVGWIAASLALLTAYTRVLGAAVGGGEHFVGPMSKPHRMALVTVAAVLTVPETFLFWPQRVMALALILICLGCLWTTGRRLKLIAAGLKDKTAPQ